MAPPPTASRAIDDPADGSSSSSRHHVEPPAKRVRREYPWRPEFERDFGVRPIQVDAATGDAVLVECRFCVSFGREPPATLAAPPTVNKAGQPIKSRARTRNIAHWKYPFRTDNMRSHHLQQHGRKWDEYTTLLEQTKQQQQRSDDADEKEDAERPIVSHRLNAFFGEPLDPPAAPIAAATVSVAAQSNGAVAPRSSTYTPAVPALLPTITSTAIVDSVLPFLIDLPASDTDLLRSDTPSTAPLLVPMKTTRDGIDEDAVATQYSIACGPVADPRNIVPLLGAGLSFCQVAEVLSSIHSGNTATLTRGDVSAFARALVASGLERIAQLLAAAWTYSVRLTVHTPSSDRTPTPMSVSVCVPVDQSRDVVEFHVATLTLRQSSESKDRVEHNVGVLLSAVDRDWQQKLLSVDVGGAVHCLGVHADLGEKLRSLLAEPIVVSVVDGRQRLDHAVQTAWALFRHQKDENASFTDTLLQLVANVRSTTEIALSHPHCPFVRLDDVRSVMRALKWLLARRDALAEKDIKAPVWWWLVGHVFMDVWTDYLVTAVGKMAGSRDEAAREVVDLLVASLTEKCGVAATKVSDASKGRRGSGASDRDSGCEVVEFDESTRTAILRVCSGSAASRLSWSSKEVAQWLRMLNVSTRRMVTELGKDSSSLRITERQVSRFVLLLLSVLQQSTSAAGPTNGQRTNTSSASRAPAPHPSLPPPTLPLDFVAIDASDIVDFVETHSRRLERAFPTMFLDLVSREIRDLQSRLSTNSALCNDLERVSQRAAPETDEQPSAFAAAWALVPQYLALRTLAAGLRTAIGTPNGRATIPLVAFGRAENDETPGQVIAELAVEACAHARQLERLQRAFTETLSASDLVV